MSTRNTPLSRKRRGPKPSKTAPDIIDAICKMISEEAMPVNEAARLCGVLPDTLKKRRASDPSVDERIETARAASMRMLLRLQLNVATVGKRSNGIEFRLERQFPLVFGPPTQKHRHEGGLADQIGALLAESTPKTDDDSGA